MKTLIRKIPVWQWIILIVAACLLLDALIQRADSRSRKLNALIQSQGSEQLKAYPYQFHVLRVENGTAVIATPRSPSVPVTRFLKVIHPDLNVMDNNNPAFIAAQETLGRIQAEARTIVLSQPDIREVTWELDKKWLSRHHIEYP